MWAQDYVTASWSAALAGLALILVGRRLWEDTNVRFTADEIVHDPVRAADVRREVLEFFDRKRRKFTVELMPSGTPFQQNVWSALQRIPFGETRSYGQLATDLGKPDAARAIGRANATNPICLIIPCHRVIGGDGSLTGYAFGEEIKRQLIAHEKTSIPALV